jgi:hypothetical protein
MRPPDLGATDPPNRHKNRHRTVSEPLWGDDVATRTQKPTPTGGNKAIPIPPEWQPDERVFAWAEKQGITREWVQAQVDEFLVYWTDAGEHRKSWDATFINRLQTLQAKAPKGQDNEPKRRLADKDYNEGATPLDQIPWMRPASVG